MVRYTKRLTAEFGRGASILNHRPPGPWAGESKNRTPSRCRTYREEHLESCL